jgi:cytochrome c-type biogenesis protein
MKDSLRESMPSDAPHEQAITRPLSHDELVQLQRVAAQAGVFADLGRQGHDLARAA